MSRAGEFPMNNLSAITTRTIANFRRRMILFFRPRGSLDCYFDDRVFGAAIVSDPLVKCIFDTGMQDALIGEREMWAQAACVEGAGIVHAVNMHKRDCSGSSKILGAIAVPLDKLKLFPEL